jgi:hypothetical protein
MEDLINISNIGLINHLNQTLEYVAKLQFSENPNDKGTFMGKKAIIYKGCHF